MAGGAITANGQNAWCCLPKETVLTENTPSADFLIRPAEEEDEAATVALWRACGLVASYNNPHADFRFARAGAASDVLVAVGGDGHIMGSVMVGHDGHRGWLYYVAADPGARSRGIGREVVRAAEAWLRERGIRKTQLLVRRSNAGVVAFYERWVLRNQTWSSCSVGSTERDREWWHGGHDMRIPVIVIGWSSRW